MLLVRPVVLAALFGASLSGGSEITIPLHDGTIVLVDPQFIRVSQYNTYIPELSFRMRNQTSTWWRTIRLRFDMGGICNGELRQWSEVVTTSLGWKGDGEVIQDYRDRIIPLFGKVDGCRTEIINAVLVYAENERLHVEGMTNTRVDLKEQLQEIKAKRDAEGAARAERARIAAERKAKLDAEEAAHQRRLAVERNKREAAEAQRRAKAEAEERAKLRAACAGVYKNTSDKRVGDLTVKEEQQVRACQTLGLYGPQ